MEFLFFIHTIKKNKKMAKLIIAFIMLGLVASSLQDGKKNCDSIKATNRSLINNESILIIKP